METDELESLKKLNSELLLALRAAATALKGCRTLAESNNAGISHESASRALAILESVGRTPAADADGLPALPAAHSHIYPDNGGIHYICYTPAGPGNHYPVWAEDQVRQAQRDAIVQYRALATSTASLPAPDYWMSIQHGEFKVSYTDDSDPAYEWFPVWTRPMAGTSELDRNASSLR